MKVEKIVFPVQVLWQIVQPIHSKNNLCIYLYMVYMYMMHVLFKEGSLDHFRARVKISQNVDILANVYLVHLQVE